VGQSKLFEGPLEDGKGEFLLRRRNRFAGQQVATGKIGDGADNSSGGRQA
jgi:hypothetical protein